MKIGKQRRSCTRFKLIFPCCIIILSQLTILHSHLVSWVLPWGSTHRDSFSFFFFLNPVPWTARVWAHCTLHVTISKFPGPAARVTRSLMTETTRLSRNLLLLRAVLALYSDTICTASLLHPLTVGCPKAQTLTFPFQNPFLSPRFHPCAGSITIIKHIPARHFPWTLSSTSSCTQPLVWALSDTH